MSRKKPPAPPLDWLRQSVWAGEELPDELELLQELEPSPPQGGEGGRAKRGRVSGQAKTMVAPAARPSPASLRSAPSPLRGEGVRKKSTAKPR